MTENRTERRKFARVTLIRKNWNVDPSTEFKEASVGVLGGLADLSTHYSWDRARPALIEAKNNRQRGRGHPNKEWTPDVVRNACQILKGRVEQDNANESDNQQENCDLGRLTLPPTEDSSDPRERQEQKGQTQPPDNEGFTSKVLRFLQELFDQPLVRFTQFSDDIRVPQISDSGVTLGSVRIAERHWVAVRFRYSSVEIYDSLYLGGGERSVPDQSRVEAEVVRYYKAAFKARTRPYVTYSAPVMRYEDDCEAVALAVLVCVAVDTAIDPAMDPACCRRMLNHLCTPPVSFQDTASEDELSTLPVPESFCALSSGGVIPAVNGGPVLNDIMAIAQALIPFLENEHARLKMRKTRPCVWSCLELVKKMRDTASLSKKLSPYIAGCLDRAEASLRNEIHDPNVNHTRLKEVTNSIHKARALGGYGQFHVG